MIRNSCFFIFNPFVCPEGCIEAYASASSVRRRVHEARVALQGEAQLEEMSTSDIFAMAALWDPNSSQVSSEEKLQALCAQIIDETARYIAIFCVNLCRFYDPQLILLGYASYIVYLYF